MKVLFVWSDYTVEFNSSWHRVFVPERALRRAGGYEVDTLFIDDLSHDTALSQTACAWADLILIQRNIFGSVITQIERYRAQGKAVAVDLDDGYLQMTGETGSMSFELWRLGIATNPKDGKKTNLEPPPMECLQMGLRLAGAVTAPSRWILTDWETYAKGHFIPNYIDPRLYKRHEVYREPGWVTIGWGGSMGHTESWTKSGIGPALKEITRMFPKTRLMLVGDPKFASMIGLTSSHVLSIPWTPLALWSKALSHFDIGLVPLAGDYDRRRSALKSTEYTVMGIPWIGSDEEPNRYLETGTLVDNTTAAWVAALSEYIKHLKDYKRQAAQNVPIGLSWSADEHTADLWAIYEKIVEQEL